MAQVIPLFFSSRVFIKPLTAVSPNCVAQTDGPLKAPHASHVVRVFLGFGLREEISCLNNVNLFSAYNKL